MRLRCYQQVSGQPRHFLKTEKPLGMRLFSDDSYRIFLKRVLHFEAEV